jgi:uncharacterized membrane protein
MKITPSLINSTRWVAVSSLLGLMLLGLVWELWLAPLRPGGSWWVIKIFPLILPLAGLLKKRMYTYRWVSLLVWVYFTEGIVRATSEKGTSAALAWIEVALCLVLFTVCALHVRWRLKSVVTAPPVSPQTAQNASAANAS